MSSSVLHAPRHQPEEASSWQLWGLIKQELLFLCWALMDVAIIAPLAIIVMRWAQYWSVGQLTIWLLLLILLPFNLVRLLSALDVAQPYRWRILLVALLVVLLLCWRGMLYAPRPLLDLGWLSEFFVQVGDLSNPAWARDLALFLFVMLAWWRGLRLVQLTPNIDRIGFRLRAGVLPLAPLAVILFAIGRFWTAVPFVLLYFLAGLTAVALIRAEQIERERSGFAASLTPRWVLTVFLTSLLVAAIAGLLAALISGEGMRVLSGRLAPLWLAMLATVATSLSTFVYLFSPLLNILVLIFGWIADLFARIFAGFRLGLGSGTPFSLEDLQPFNDLVRDETLLALDVPAPVSRILVIALMLGLAAVVTFVLNSLFRQPPTAARSGDSLLYPEAGIEAAPTLRDRILDRLGLLQRWRTAASIRRIYSSMCQTAASVGYPRAPAETPYEYLPTLHNVWPVNAADFRLITEAYIRVRYGEIPETAAELEEIKAAWQRLSSAEIAIETAVSAPDQGL